MNGDDGSTSSETTPAVRTDGENVTKRVSFTVSVVAIASPTFMAGIVPSIRNKTSVIAICFIMPPLSVTNTYQNKYRFI